MLLLLLVLLVARQYFYPRVTKEPIDVSAFQQELEQLKPVKSPIKKQAFVSKKIEKTFVSSLKEIQLDINAADTAAWKRLKGIGSTFANRICKYRKILGGFYAKEQLLEVYGIDTLRYLAIEHQLVVDPRTQPLIDVNSAELEVLSAHPYLSYHQARAIVRYRKQHGAYQSIADIQEIDLIEPADFRKIAPYLTANAHPKDSIGN